MKKDATIIDFEDVITDKLLDKNIRDGISSIAFTGKYLWIAGDENISIQRLEKLKDGTYGKGRNFFLKDFIDLPSPDDEADIEGMDVEGDYLYIVGSHSYKRKKAREESEDWQKEIQRLSKTKLGPNRNLLARIPIVKDENDALVLKKEAQNPKNPEKQLTASKLKHSKKKWSQLTKVLKDDEHLSSFMGLPGKDNGFDIEGLAVYENKVFLGLRGPVLRGWAIILEVQLAEMEEGFLELKTNEDGNLYKKHFINLYGMGIRELVCQEKDLIILAGPSMDLDGVMEIYRWKNGTQHDAGQLVKREDMESLFIFPQEGKVHGRDKAEGLALREDNKLFVAYDSPKEERTIGKYKVALDAIWL